VVISPHTARGRHEMRQRLLRAFRTAGALSPERARTMQQLGLTASDLFRNYREHDIVREPKAGEFYLDEDAEQERQMNLVRWVMVPVIAFLLALLLFAIAIDK